MSEEDDDSQKMPTDGLTRTRKSKKSTEQPQSTEKETNAVEEVIDSVQEVVEEVTVTAAKEVAARAVGAKGAEIASEITKEAVHEVGEAIQEIISPDGNNDEEGNDDSEDSVIDIEDEEVDSDQGDDLQDSQIENTETKEEETTPDEDQKDDKTPSLKDALAIIGKNDESDEIKELTDEEDTDTDTDTDEKIEVETSEEEIEGDSEFTLKSLIRALLAKETLPHILLLIVASSSLFVFAKLDSENSGMIAMSFISLCIGYTTIALSSANEKIYSLLQAKSIALESDDEKLGVSIQAKLTRLLKSWIKAWSLPLIFSGITFGIMLALFGKDSRLEEIGNMLPMILGGFFIVWSATQAISFKNSVVASIKRRTDTSEPIETDPKPMLANIAQMFTILAFSVILVVIFYHYLQGAEGDITEVFWGEGGIFLAIVLAMVLLLQNSTRSMRIIAGHRKNTSRFTFWWSLILGLFMSWHLLSIYRRVVGADDNMLMIIEEIALMIFTVLLTIWSLSSRGISKGSKVFTERNALFWGLSFGFGYAGSITMVTVIVDKNVDFVMGIGHGVTLLTLLILHRTAIKNSLKDAELMNSDGEFLITPKKGW